MRSLRWRIMGSTVLVVVLTVLISVGVGYYATQSRLGVFVNQIGNDEASQLERSLSREYTAAGGWETGTGRCPKPDIYTIKVRLVSILRTVTGREPSSSTKTRYGSS